VVSRRPLRGLLNHQ
jgi:hypothetical protein